MSSLQNMLYSMGTDIANAPVRASENRRTMLENRLFGDEAQYQADKLKKDREYDARLEQVSRESQLGGLQSRAARLGGGQKLFSAPAGAQQGPAGMSPAGAAIDPNKPKIFNPDGSISTEKTITVQHPRDGSYHNIATIIGGVAHDPAEVEAAFAASPDSFTSLGRFESVEEAVGAAQQRSDQIGRGLQAAGAPAPQQQPQTQPQQPQSVQSMQREADAARRPLQGQFGEMMAVTDPMFGNRDRASYNAQRALEAMQAGDQAGFDYYSNRSNEFEQAYLAEDRAAKQGLLDHFLLRMRPTAPEGSQEYYEQAALRRNQIQQALAAMGPESVAGIPPYVADMLMNEDPLDDDHALLLMGAQAGLDLPEWAQDIEVDPATGRITYKDGVRFSTSDAGQTQQQAISSEIEGYKAETGRINANAARDNADTNRINALTEREKAMGGGPQLKVHPRYAGASDTLINAVDRREAEFVEEQYARADRLSEVSDLAMQFLALATDENGEQAYNSFGQGWVSAAERFFSSKKTQFTNITNRLAPLQREAGSGQMSDKDVEMFKQAVPNLENSFDANVQIVKRMLALEQNHAEYMDMLDMASEIGGIGAQREFISLYNDYKNEHPIFNRETGQINMGDDMVLQRPSFREWYQSRATAQGEQVAANLSSEEVADAASVFE